MDNGELVAKKQIRMKMKMPPWMVALQLMDAKGRKNIVLFESNWDVGGSRAHFSSIIQFHFVNSGPKRSRTLRYSIGRVRNHFFDCCKTDLSYGYNHSSE